MIDKRGVVKISIFTCIILSVGFIIFLSGSSGAGGDLISSQNMTKIYLNSSDAKILTDINSSFKESINDKYGIIRLANDTTWNNNSKIAEYSLTKNTEYCLTNCEAEGKAVLYQDGILFDSAKFQTLTGKDTSISSYEILLFDSYQDNLVDVPDTYRKVCENMNISKPEGTCYDVVNSTKKINQPIEVWSKYNKEILKAGDYRWKIKGTKNIKQDIDFILINNKIEFSEWAVWQSSYNVGLVAYWDFNQSNGVSFTDIVRGKHNFTARGTPITNGKIQNATQMGYSATGIYATYDQDFNFTKTGNNYSICGWMNETSAPAGYIQGSANCIYEWLFGAGGGIRFGEANSGDRVTGSTPASRYAWTFICQTFNGTSMAGYTNSTIQGSIIISDWSYTANNWNFQTGYMGIGSENIVYDEMMLFNRTLSQDEITNMYNEGNGMQYIPDVQDTTKPLITILTPTNFGNYTNTTIWFNVTANENIDSCNFSLNGGANITMISSNVTNFYNISTVSDGNYLARFWCNDSSNNANETEIVNFSIDSTPAKITIIKPTSFANYTNQTTWFNITSNEALTGCRVSIDNWATNITMTSTNTTNYYNISTVADGNHLARFRCNDTFGNVNATEFVNFSIDTLKPNVTNLIESPSDPATFSTTQVYIFNATITDANLDTVLFQLNNVNYTTTNFSSNFTKSFTGLGVGSYNYTWFSNDTFGNMNFSENGTFTVNQAIPTITLLINGTAGNQTIVYGSSTNVSVTNSNSEQTIILYKDGSVDTANNFLVRTLGSNDYNFTAVVQATQNYSYATLTRWSHISKATPTITLLINNTAGNQTIIYNSTTNISATVDNSQQPIILYKNNVVATADNFLVKTYGVGDYNFTAVVSSSDNYSYSTLTRWSHIYQATGNISTYLNHTRSNITLEMPYTIWLNATLITGSGDIQLYKNSALINSGSSPIKNSTLFNVSGLYNITSFYSGNENYTGFSETWWANVSDTIYPQINLTDPLNKTYNLNISALNYSFIEINPDICWYTLNNGIANVSITCGTNATGLTSTEGTNTWKIYVNDTIGNENSSSVTFFKDTISPTIDYSGNTETNNSYLARRNINVNISVTELNFVNITVYLYNSSLNIINTTVRTSKGIYVNFTNLTDGNYYFNASTLDVAGNTNKTSLRKVTIDNIAPVVTINIPNTNYTTGQFPVTFNVSTNENTTVRFSLDLGSTNYTMVTADNLSFSYYYFTLAGGNYNFTVYANDSANNKNNTFYFPFSVTAPTSQVGTGTGGGGGGTPVNTTQVCRYIYDSLVQRKGDINYSKSELSNLSEYINTKISPKANIDYIKWILESFELRCEMKIPTTFKPFNQTISSLSVVDVSFQPPICSGEINSTIKVLNAEFDLDESLPFFNIDIKNPKCSQLELLRWVFRVNNVGDKYEIDGLKVWWMVTMSLGIFIVVSFKPKPTKTIKLNKYGRNARR